MVQAAAWSMVGKQVVKEPRRQGGLRRGSGTQGAGAGVAGGSCRAPATTALLKVPMQKKYAIWWSGF